MDYQTHSKKPKLDCWYVKNSKNMSSVRYCFHFIIIVLCLACTRSPKEYAVNAINQKHEEFVGPKVKLEDSINSVNHLANNLMLIDSIEFFKKHIEPMSHVDYDILAKNEDYKFPLLLNNRSQTFEDGDMNYSFSSSLEAKIGYSNSELINTGKYVISIYDKNNTIVGKTKVIGLGSEESDDRFIPFENGKGFIQLANRLELSCNVKIFKQNNNKNFDYYEIFELVSDKVNIIDIKISEDSKYMSILKEFDNNYFSISKLTIDGKLLFEKKYARIGILSNSLNISNDGSYISFSYYQEINAKFEKKYCVLDKNGDKIIDIKVNEVGNYTSNYININGHKYLIVDGITVYIFDLINKTLVKEITSTLESPEVTSYRLFINKKELYILFISYVHLEHHKAQDKKVLQKFSIETGELLSTLNIPVHYPISLFYEDGKFYLMNRDSNHLIYKLKP